MSRNKTKGSRRYLKLVSRFWIASGVLALIGGTIYVNSAPRFGADGSAQVNFTEAQAATPFDMPRLTEAERLWKAESGDMGDPFTAGKAAYDIAAVTHDPRWAHLAVERLGQAREEFPTLVQATAYRGAAQSLMARDYPIKGAWMVVPGPGFARIWYVKRAERFLDQAVSEAPKDPVVRLLRAGAISGMPGILVDHDIARADFELLASWLKDPSQNPDFADVLGSTGWRMGFLATYSGYLAAAGRADDAKTLRAELEALARS